MILHKGVILAGIMDGVFKEIGIRNHSSNKGVRINLEDRNINKYAQTKLT